MKARRIFPFFLILVVLSGCTSVQPTIRTTPPIATITSARTETETATTSAESDPTEEWLHNAEELLVPSLPEGFTLSQVLEGSSVKRVLLPDSGNGSILLPDLFISAGRIIGEIVPDALLDGDFMKSASLLAQNGMSIDVTRYGTSATNGDAYALLTGILAAVGDEIDTAGIDASVLDPALRRALAVGLERSIPYDEKQTCSEIIGRYAYQELMSRAVVYQECSVLQRAGTSATLIDASRLWPLITDETSLFRKNNAALTRLDLGRAFYRIYTAYHPGAEAPEYFELAEVTDIIWEEADLIRFLVYYDCMNTYPDYTTFSPDLPVHLDELPELLNQFWLALSNAEEEGEEERKNPASEDGSAWHIMTYSEIVGSADRFLEYYLEIKRPEEDAVKIVNLPDYSIYVNQRDGSEYAANNCMPSITCMAIHWWDNRIPVTPDELRRKYSTTEGWYMYMVTEQLTEYGVPWKESQITADAIVDAIDAGNIVLAQFSTWDVTSTGHCFVIVGYQRKGGALWFCVEDPEGENQGIYGRPENEEKWIESEYALWSIRRFSNQLIIVLSPRNAGEDTGTQEVG